MTAPTPEQMGALAGNDATSKSPRTDADCGLLNNNATTNPAHLRVLADDVQHTVDNGYEFAPENVVAALRAAADQLEAVPTRDQIAKALHRSDESTSYDPFDYDRGADAVLALLTGKSDG